MELKIVWQDESNTPENTSHLEKIRQWWRGLNGKKINWVQRLIPQTGNASEIHWTPQRFDDTFVLMEPDFRDSTLYWHTADSSGEHNSIVQRLELDNLHQHLYIYPQNQREIVVRVGLPEIHYQTIELKYPDVVVDSHQVIVFRDSQEQVEVKVTLSETALHQLKQLL